jgi:hypothetical protein
MLHAIHLQKTLSFQHDPGHVHLGIDVQRHPFARIETR